MTTRKEYRQALAAQTAIAHISYLLYGKTATRKHSRKIAACYQSARRICDDVMVARRKGDIAECLRLLAQAQRVAEIAKITGK